MEIGDTTSLRSGGPIMTVVNMVKLDNDHALVTCMYFNTVTGLVETCNIPMVALRASFNLPVAPDDVKAMRGTSVSEMPKSSL